MSEKVPSGHASPTKIEKSSSSSESSVHFDFDSYIPPESLNQGKIRPSSWDESDVDELIEREGTQLHSSESQKFKASVAAEINELKKQFFESLQKLKNSNYEPLEIEKKMMEIKSEDRRQCPARVRRRTKSSSSLSPVLESKNSTENSEGLDEVSDDVKHNLSNFSSKYYLNNFFNDLRTKRISFIDPPLTPNKTDEEDTESKDKDEEPIPLGDDLTNDDDSSFCKTARKLSQIMEVEENKRDLDKSSDEMSKNTHLFSKRNTSPFQSARSTGEKISKDFTKTRKESFKSLSFEDFGDSEDQTPSHGSISERSHKFFKKKPRDNFSFLSVKSPKFKIKSPKFFERRSSKSPKESKHFNSQSEKEFSQDSSSKEDEKENLDSIDCLKIDLTKKLNSEDPTPRSTDRSESNRTTQTRSEKSRNSNLESPIYRINTDRGSVRSLRLEDVNSPDSLKKDTESESKTISYTDKSPKKSRRKLIRSGKSSKQKSDRNTENSDRSVESLKSSNSKESDLSSPKSRKSKSTERSKCQSEKMKKDDFCSERNEPTEYCSPVESSRGYKIPVNSIIGSPVHEELKSRSQRSSKTSLRSSRSSKSTNSPKSPRKKLFSHSFEQAIPTIDINFPLDISESQKLSYRSVKGDELNTGRSDTNRPMSRRSSDRSSSSKSKNTARTNTKISPRTSGGISNRSKENFENANESPQFEANSWREPKNISSNLTSPGTSSRKSSSKMQNMSSRQSSFRRRESDLERDELITPINIEFLEEQPSTSRRSSIKSVESTRNSSPTKSIKFSLDATNSEERIFPNVHSNIEKIYYGVTNEMISNKISSISEDEDVKETQNSSQRLRSESESDRYSEKRLSIINEASIEDLVNSNDSFENEDSSSREPSRKSRREQLNISRSSKNTGRSQKETPKDDDRTHGQKWNELIETFCENPDTSLILENAFPGFSFKTETSWNYKENTNTKIDSEENQKTSTTGAEIKNDIYFMNEMEKKEEPKNSQLDYGENSLEKSIKKDIQSLQNFQNLYYVEVTDQAPFGIGEGGDVRNWNADKSDTPEKPKAYGDGLQLQNSSELLAILGKKEKEAKTQRHLWTDLRGDFRSSKQKLQKLLSELEDDTNFKQLVSVGLKKSQSDNCIAAKNDDENHLKISDAYELKSKSKSELGALEEKISAAKNTAEGDLEILEYEKETENIEFDCETPRRSRSMIDLNIQLEKENFEDIELNSNFHSSGSQLFERASITSKKEKESTNLNIFLARNQKEEKTPVKSNNWLNFKAFEPEKSNKKGKKIKRKRKDMKSPRGSHHAYLYTGRSRSSVPALKLRNSNCFQNFYKRIVSVFCLTTQSSAETSK